MSKSIIKQKRILTKAGGGSSISTPVSVANGGTGISSYAIGDIIYASGATTLSKLGIGGSGQILIVSSGIPAWSGTGLTFTGGNLLTVTGIQNNFDIGVGVAGSVTGTITLKNSSNTNTLTLQAGATNGLNAFVFPATNGSSGQYLQTNGSGTTSWQTVDVSSYLPLIGATYTTTTGNGLALTTSTLTTGNLLSLASTGTAAGSNTQTVLNISTSGANGTSSQTTYGLQVSNTHTGTSSTNIGGYFTATGGATANYGGYFAGGTYGIQCYNGLRIGDAHEYSTGQSLYVQGQVHAIYHSGAYRYQINYTAGSPDRLTFTSNIQENYYVKNNTAYPFVWEGASGVEWFRMTSNNFYFNGVTNSSAASFALNAVGGSGLNNVGANFTIAAGRSTGNSTPAVINFQSTAAGASSSTAQTLATVLQITNSTTITTSDAVNYALGSTTGTKFGTATTQKLAFWNATPIVQPSGATQAAPAAYATGAFGLDSDANMQALYDLVVAMRTALVNVGIMKGSA